MLRKAVLATVVVAALLAVPIGAADAGLAFRSSLTYRCDTATGTWVVTLTIKNYSTEGYLSGTFESGIFEATGEGSGPTISGELTFDPNPVPEGYGEATVAVFSVPGTTPAVKVEFEIFYPAGPFTGRGSDSLELDGDCAVEPPIGVTTTRPAGTSASTAPPAAARTATPTFAG
ncbi:hypothetical protein [Rhabdothermincola sp.]|uniref:hypothetical protein n=1 Tax=Rhabdothermincola sp. TaxID=2820405 RepID=UPI002FE319F0